MIANHDVPWSLWNPQHSMSAVAHQPILHGLHSALAQTSLLIEMVMNASFAVSVGHPAWESTSEKNMV